MFDSVAREFGLGIRTAKMLVPSAFLASAASTLELQQSLLPPSIQTLVDKSTETTETTGLHYQVLARQSTIVDCVEFRK